MNQDLISSQRRTSRVARVLRVLLALAALTGASLSLGACSVCTPDADWEPDGWG